MPFDESYVELKDEDGRIYFWNRRDNTRGWALPEGLSAKWVGQKSPDGRTYYWSRENKERVWVLPSLSPLVAAAPAAASEGTSVARDAGGGAPAVAVAAQEPRVQAHAAVETNGNDRAGVSAPPAYQGTPGAGPPMPVAQAAVPPAAPAEAALAAAVLLPAAGADVSGGARSVDGQNATGVTSVTQEMTPVVTTQPVTSTAPAVGTMMATSTAPETTVVAAAMPAPAVTPVVAPVLPSAPAPHVPMYQPVVAQATTAPFPPPNAQYVGAPSAAMHTGIVSPPMMAGMQWPMSPAGIMPGPMMGTPGPIMGHYHSMSVAPMMGSLPGSMPGAPQANVPGTMLGMPVGTAAGISATGPGATPGMMFATPGTMPDAMPQGISAPHGSFTPGPPPSTPPPAAAPTLPLSLAPSSTAPAPKLAEVVGMAGMEGVSADLHTGKTAENPPADEVGQAAAKTKGEDEHTEEQGKEKENDVAVLAAMPEREPAGPRGPSTSAVAARHLIATAGCDSWFHQAANGVYEEVVKFWPPPAEAEVAKKPKLRNAKPDLHGVRELILRCQRHEELVRALLCVQQRSDARYSARMFPCPKASEWCFWTSDGRQLVIDADTPSFADDTPDGRGGNTKPVIKRCPPDNAQYKLLIPPLRSKISMVFKTARLRRLEKALLKQDKVLVQELLGNMSAAPPVRLANAVQKLLTPPPPPPKPIEPMTKPLGPPPLGMPTPPIDMPFEGVSKAAGMHPNQVSGIANGLGGLPAVPPLLSVPATAPSASLNFVPGAFTGAAPVGCGNDQVLGVSPSAPLGTADINACAGTGPGTTQSMPGAMPPLPFPTGPLPPAGPNARSSLLPGASQAVGKSSAPDPNEQGQFLPQLPQPPPGPGLGQISMPGQSGGAASDSWGSTSPPGSAFGPGTPSVSPPSGSDGQLAKHMMPMQIGPVRPGNGDARVKSGPLPTGAPPAFEKAMGFQSPQHSPQPGPPPPGPPPPMGSSLQGPPPPPLGSAEVLGKSSSVSPGLPDVFAKQTNLQPPGPGQTADAAQGDPSYSPLQPTSLPPGQTGFGTSPLGGVPPGELGGRPILPVPLRPPPGPGPELSFGPPPQTQVPHRAADAPALCAAVQGVPASLGAVGGPTMSETSGTCPGMAGPQSPWGKSANSLGTAPPAPTMDVRGSFEVHGKVSGLAPFRPEEPKATATQGSGIAAPTPAAELHPARLVTLPPGKAPSIATTSAVPPHWKAPPVAAGVPASGTPTMPPVSGVAPEAKSPSTPSAFPAPGAPPLPVPLASDALPQAPPTSAGVPPSGAPLLPMPSTRGTQPEAPALAPPMSSLPPKVVTPLDGPAPPPEAATGEDTRRGVTDPILHADVQMATQPSVDATLEEVAPHEEEPAVKAAPPSPCSSSCKPEPAAPPPPQSGVPDPSGGPQATGEPVGKPCLPLPRTTAEKEQTHAGDDAQRLVEDTPAAEAPWARNRRRERPKSSPDAISATVDDQLGDALPPVAPAPSDKPLPAPSPALVSGENATAPVAPKVPEVVVGEISQAGPPPTVPAEHSAVPATAPPKVDAAPPRVGGADRAAVDAGPPRGGGADRAAAERVAASAERLVASAAAGRADRVEAAAADRLKRKVIVANLPVPAKVTELADFFTGAVFSATGHMLAAQWQSGEASKVVMNVDLSPALAGLGAGGTVAEVTFGTEAGAMIAVALNGIQFKGKALEIRRPKAYNGPPLRRAQLQGLSLKDLIASDSADAERTGGDGDVTAPAVSGGAQGEAGDARETARGKLVQLSGIPSSMSEKSVYDLLQQFGGPLERLSLNCGKEAGSHLGHGTAVYVDQASALEAERFSPLLGFIEVKLVDGMPDQSPPLPLLSAGGAGMDADNPAVATVAFDKAGSPLKPGVSIRLTGLRSAPHLEGLQGSCERWDRTTGRWHVRLANGETKAVKPENIAAQVPNMQRSMTEAPAKRPRRSRFDAESPRTAASGATDTSVDLGPFEAALRQRGLEQKDPAPELAAAVATDDAIDLGPFEAILPPKRSVSATESAPVDLGPFAAVLPPAEPQLEPDLGPFEAVLPPAKHARKVAPEDDLGPFSEVIANRKPVDGQTPFEDLGPFAAAVHFFAEKGQSS